MPKITKLEKDPTTIKRMRLKRVLSCTYCKPNRNENSKKRNKLRSKSWKVKTKKERQYLTSK